MIDYNEINEALKTVQVKASDIREIKGVLNEKFNLYFESDEVKVLAKITTPALTVVLKKINTVTLCKTGELTIDTFFSIQKDLQLNLIKLEEDEMKTVGELIQKLIVIAAIKVDETEEMTYNEKFHLFDVLIRNVEKIGLAHNVTLSEILPYGGKVLKGFRKKYETIEVNFLKKKPRKPLSNKMRARLQKEINSKCPFCEDEDVEYFEAHHIDEDPSNTVLSNMLLLCRKCHSKVGERIITKQQTEHFKANLANIGKNIEVYKIEVISENYCWRPYPHLKNAFRLEWEIANDFPIFQFHLVNNYNRTVVLTDIELQVKHLFSGFGDLPQPCEVPKSNVYNIFIESNKRVHKVNNFNGLQIPSKQAVTIQVEVAQKLDDVFINLDKRMILYFSLKFSGNILLDLPRIFINTDNENEGVPVYVLG